MLYHRVITFQALRVWSNSAGSRPKLKWFDGKNPWDKNSKLVDKKINQHAAQSDSEFYNTATSVASIEQSRHSWVYIVGSKLYRL